MKGLSRTADNFQFFIINLFAYFVIDRITYSYLTITYILIYDKQKSQSEIASKYEKIKKKNKQESMSRC